MHGHIYMAAKRCGTDSLNTPLAAKMTSGAVLTPNTYIWPYMDGPPTHMAV